MSNTTEQPKEEKHWTENGVQIEIYRPNTAAFLPTLKNSPDALIALAIEKGLNLDQLERLLLLQENWLKKIAESEYTAAHSKFKSEVPVLEKMGIADIKSKDETKRSGSYKYAKLGTIDEALKPILYRNGLTVSFIPKNKLDDKGNPKLEVTCVVSHIGGHKEHATLESYYDNTGFKNNIQSLGSTMTYLQRYTMIAALGLATADEDNDGKGAPNEPKVAKPTIQVKPAITDVAFQKALIRASKGEKVLEPLLKHFELNEEQLNAIKTLQDNAPPADTNTPAGETDKAGVKKSGQNRKSKA